MKEKPPAKVAAQSAHARPALPVSEIDQISSKQTLGAAKGLGFGVDLWGDSVSVAPLPKGDLLADVSSSEKVDAGIFNKISGSTSTSGGTSVATSKVVRVGSDVDETKLNDLRVSERLLAREEELDYAMFGKSSHAVQLNQKKVVATVNSGQDRGDFDLESSDVLAKLEAATLVKDPTFFNVSSTQPFVAEAPKIEVDLAAIDLNSYIKQQEESNGGGLFD